MCWLFALQEKSMWKFWSRYSVVHDDLQLVSTDNVPSLAQTSPLYTCSNTITSTICSTACMLHDEPTTSVGPTSARFCQKCHVGGAGFNWTLRLGSIESIYRPLLTMWIKPMVHSLEAEPDYATEWWRGKASISELARLFWAAGRRPYIVFTFTGSVRNVRNDV